MNNRPALIIYARRGPSHIIFYFFSHADAKSILAFLHLLYFLPHQFSHSYTNIS